jgi:hypothetical protein
MPREHRRQSGQPNLAKQSSSTTIAPVQNPLHNGEAYFLIESFHPLRLQCSACGESFSVRSMKAWNGKLRAHLDTHAQTRQASAA